MQKCPPTIRIRDGISVVNTYIMRIFPSYLIKRDLVFLFLLLMKGCSTTAFAVNPFSQGPNAFYREGQASIISGGFYPIILSGSRGSLFDISLEVLQSLGLFCDRIRRM